MVHQVINNQQCLEFLVHLFIHYIMIEILMQFFLYYSYLGGMYAQQSIVQYKQVPTVVPFGQQTSFPNQQSSLTQLNQLSNQISVTSNQLPINQNQITMNSTPLGPVASNSLGNCLHVGQINQMNGVPNPAITMQSQMVYITLIINVL